MSGKGEKEQVYARYVASGKTQEHLASWGKTLAEVMNPEGKPEVLAGYVTYHRVKDIEQALAERK